MATNDDGALRFQFKHAMIPVADLDRSVDFYQRLFGMTVLRRRKPDEDGRATAYVGYGNEDANTVLELISGTGQPAGPWAGHLAISVSDLTALCARLQAEGVRFSKPLRAVDGGTRSFTANIYDPDGIELELSQPRS